MADAIRDDLADFFTDSATAYPVTGMDADGNMTLGAGIAVTGRLSGKVRMVRDTTTGQEIVSSYELTIPAVNGFKVPRSTASGWEGHVFDLAGERPGSKLKPIYVYVPRDENGVHHEVVMFK